MTKLNELWSIIPEPSNKMEMDTLELLKQGKKEYAIRKKLNLSEITWKNMRAKLFGQLKIFLRLRGIPLQILPNEKQAEKILFILNSKIVVAYSLKNYEYDVLDNYLSYLEELGFIIEDVSPSLATEDEHALLEQIPFGCDNFTLLLGESYQSLIDEIQKDRKRPLENLSSTYVLLINSGLIRGEAISLEKQIKYFNEQIF